MASIYMALYLLDDVTLPLKVWEMHFLKCLAMLWAQPFRPDWDRAGLIWSEHLLSLVFAGHIKPHGFHYLCISHTA